MSLESRVWSTVRNKPRYRAWQSCVFELIQWISNGCLILRKTNFLSQSPEKHDIFRNFNTEKKKEEREHKFEKSFWWTSAMCRIRLRRISTRAPWNYTRMVMGISGSVTTSFPPPVIHDSDVFSLPRFMLTPSYIFTPSITSHFSSLSLILSLLPPPNHLVWFMESVGILTDQPPSDVLSTISSRLSKAPFLGAKSTRRAAELIVFITHTCYATGCFEVHSWGESSRL